MHDAGASAHALHGAALNHRAVALAVAVIEGAVEDDGQDLHLAVGMCSEARPRRDLVLVDDPQGTETHALRIVPAAEREAVAAVEPAETRAAAIFVAVDVDHDGAWMSDGRGGYGYHSRPWP